MKAVILAAGAATRLRPLTNDLPKCLLPVGDSTILGMTVDNLTANGVQEFVLVTGYREDQIHGFMSARYPGLRVTFLTNERFADTNNSYSLWLTREHLRNHAMLLLDSDIVFDRGIVSLLLHSDHEDCLAVVRAKTLGDEEIKVRTDAAGTILEISKEVVASTAFGESIGIEKFSTRLAGRLFDVLQDKIVTRKQHNQFYEAAFQELIDGGEHIYAVDVGGLPCVEIDTPEDLTAARALFVNAGGRPNTPGSR
ncbi:MAG: phosphocholine cytidylyltransferase family protein [Bacteroidetes bacterium]|nr:phosphocholine cytidylyltransferase family protein [Bacteroidota bacterium]